MSPAGQELAATANRLLDEASIDAAIESVRASLAEIAEAEPHLLLRIMDTLNKLRRDGDLSAFATLLQEHDLLPVETEIFTLRIAFRAHDYLACLAIIDRVLALSDRNVEALRTGGRIGNLTQNDTVALRYWERLAEIAPADQEAALQAARIHWRHAQHAEAFFFAS